MLYSKKSAYFMKECFCEFKLFLSRTEVECKNVKDK